MPCWFLVPDESAAHAAFLPANLNVGCPQARAHMTQTVSEASGAAAGPGGRRAARPWPQDLGGSRDGTVPAAAPAPLPAQTLRRPARTPPRAGNGLAPATAAGVDTPGPGLPAAEGRAQAPPCPPAPIPRGHVKLRRNIQKG